MKTTSWMLFVVLSTALAWGQRPPDTNDGCVAISGNGPHRHIGAPTGALAASTITYSGSDCNDENEASCMTMELVSYCCGKYPINTPIDPCLFAEMKNPLVRARILELAEDIEILIPTCGGAYAPARIAFRDHKEPGHGGL